MTDCVCVGGGGNLALTLQHSYGYGTKFLVSNSSLKIPRRWYQATQAGPDNRSKFHSSSLCSKGRQACSALKGVSPASLRCFSLLPVMLANPQIWLNIVAKEIKFWIPTKKEEVLTITGTEVLGVWRCIQWSHGPIWLPRGRKDRHTSLSIPWHSGH